MNNSGIYLVIGANGVGKSAILSYLKTSTDDAFDIHDFDERGVPNNADKIWRQSETSYWLELGNRNIQKNISTIVCGFMKPVEIIDISRKLGIIPKVCLLDVDKNNLEKRLLGRYPNDESIQELTRTTGKTLEKFIQDNVYVTSLLKKDSVNSGFYVLNTSNLNPAQVSVEVLNWIRNCAK